MTGHEKASAAGLTDIGRRRKINEDAILCLPEASFFCVADGLGGGRAGDIASKLVVETLEAEIRKSENAWDSLGLDARGALVRTAAGRANVLVRQQAHKRGFDQMGSTLVALVLDPRLPGKGLAIHAGDSRIYRFNDGRLDRLTEDHTYGTEVDDDGGGGVPPASRDALTCGIGLCEQLELTTTVIETRQGDFLVLCSDGLTRMVPDKSVLRVLRRSSRAGVRVAAQSLIDAANAAGGEDNVSIVVVDPGPVPGVQTGAGARPEGWWAGRFDRAVNEHITTRMMSMGLLAAAAAVVFIVLLPALENHSTRQTQAAIGPRQGDLATSVATPEPVAAVAPQPAALGADGGGLQGVPKEEAPRIASGPAAAEVPKRLSSLPAAETPTVESGPDATPVSDRRQAAIEHALETGNWESPQQLATWAAREEQAIAMLGDLGRRVPALLQALDGRSSVTNDLEVIGAFAEHQRRSALVLAWAEGQIANGRTVTAADYPRKDIRIAAAAGDLAWQELYLMCEPLDDVAAAARTKADKPSRVGIDRIVELQRAIVADRERYPNVRTWRQRGNVAIAGTLLAAVEEWVNSPGAGRVGH